MTADKTFTNFEPPTIAGLTFEYKEGTHEGYYKISTPEDLQALATYVNAGNTCEGLTFKLTDDIDLSGVSDWTPIAANDNISCYVGVVFSGTFDGNVKTIKNLTFTETSIKCVGFFGCIKEGTVKNLTLENFNVTSGRLQYHMTKVGALIGYAYHSTIENITISGTNVKSNAEHDRIGGLVGNAISSSIKNIIVSNTTVEHERSSTSTADSEVGGVVGHIVGSNNSIEYVIVSGTTLKGTGYDKIGGLIGHVGGSAL